jgi:hypothetical protein
MGSREWVETAIVNEQVNIAEPERGGIIIIGVCVFPWA